MKVSELLGAELGYWVAKAQGWKDVDPYGWVYENEYYPWIDWQQCGDLIDKYAVDLFTLTDKYMCNIYTKSEAEFNIVEQYGSTPQEAICRAVVASVYGDEVSNKLG